MTERNEQRILVLDGELPFALACVRSLGRAGHIVNVASVYRFPLASWSRYCRSSFRSPGEDLNGMAAVRQWAATEHIGIVLPVTERSAVLCNLQRAEWEQLGIKVACASAKVLDRAFDKAETLRYAGRCGVRTPLTRCPESIDQGLAAGADVGYPCVVKPRFTSAWLGTRFAPSIGNAYPRNPTELVQAIVSRKQGPWWPLIQQYIPGKGKGVFGLCDDTRIIALFAHERLREIFATAHGSSLRRAAPLDPRVCDPAIRLLEHMQWVGPAMVEFRDDGVSEPVLMEVNGRFWGSLQLAIDAGVDFPALWIALLNGHRCEVVRNYSTDTILRWWWGDYRRFRAALRSSRTHPRDGRPSVWAALKDWLGPQPPGTRNEILRRDDLWPAFGEFVQSGALRHALLMADHLRGQR